MPLSLVSSREAWVWIENLALMWEVAEIETERRMMSVKNSRQICQYAVCCWEHSKVVDILATDRRIANFKISSSRRNLFGECLNFWVMVWSISPNQTISQASLDIYLRRRPSRRNLLGECQPNNSSSKPRYLLSCEGPTTKLSVERREKRV